MSSRRNRLIVLLLCMLLAVIASYAADQPSSTIKIPFNSDNGVAMVKVMINGKGPYNFIVDTGEEHNGVVSPKIAKELQMPQVGMGGTFDPSNGKKIEGPMFQAATLQFGGFKAEKIELFGLDVGFDGVIGLPIFKEYLCEFHANENLIFLSHGSLPETNRQDIFPYITPDGIPDMEWLIAGKPVRVHLDAGNPGTISFTRAMTAGFNWAAEPVKIGQAGTISNTFSIYEGRLKSDLHFGRYVFAQPYVVLSDSGGTHINLGFGFFKLFRSVTFDQKNQRVRFANEATAISVGQS